MAPASVEASDDPITPRPAHRFQVRLAVPDDLPAVMDLKQRMSVEERAPLALDATANDWARECFGPAARVMVLVAEQATAVVGLAIFTEQIIAGWTMPAIYVQDVYVLPECRNRGIGGALITRIAVEAAARNARLLYLNVNESNAARRLYDGLGFGPVQQCMVYALVGARIGALAACATADVVADRP